MFIVSQSIFKLIIVTTNNHSKHSKRYSFFFSYHKYCDLSNRIKRHVFESRGQILSLAIFKNAKKKEKELLTFSIYDHHQTFVLQGDIITFCVINFVRDIFLLQKVNEEPRRPSILLTPRRQYINPSVTHAQFHRTNDSSISAIRAKSALIFKSSVDGAQIRFLFAGPSETKPSILTGYNS